MNTPGWIAKKRTSVGSEASNGKTGKTNPKSMKDKGQKKILDAPVSLSSTPVQKIGKIKG